MLRIITTTDVVSADEFETFVVDMQHLALPIVQRLGMYSFNVRLDKVDSGLFPDFILWDTTSFSDEHPIGEYGWFTMEGWTSPYTLRMSRWSFHFRLGRSEEVVPVTNIQKTIDTILLLGNFADIINSEMLSRNSVFTNAMVVTFRNDGNIPAIVGFEYDRVDVNIHHRLDYFPISIEKIEETIIELSMEAREIAQRHGIDIRRLSLSLEPYELNTSLFWDFDECGEYGTLRFGFTRDRFVFEEIHVTDTQELITDDLIRAIQEAHAERVEINI